MFNWNIIILFNKITLQCYGKYELLTFILKTYLCSKFCKIAQNMQVSYCHLAMQCNISVCLIFYFIYFFLINCNTFQNFVQILFWLQVFTQKLTFRQKQHTKTEGNKNSGLQLKFIAYSLAQCKTVCKNFMKI